MPGSGHLGGSVTIDQLIALNDEMAALIRAGVPLERGLIQAGRELQGRLGAVVGDLGERLSTGDRLPEALAGSKPAVPEIYRAVVEAGLRSGRLSEALEGMAMIARHYAEMRRAVGLALIYPIVIVELAYGLTLMFILFVAPRFIEALRMLGLNSLPMLDRLAGLGDSVMVWGPIPALLVPGVVLVWIWSGRASSLDPGILGAIFRRLPVVGSMIGSFKAAIFADLLALLVDHRVPLDEAVILAGEASGDRGFGSSARLVGESIRSGREASSLKLSALPAFPPLLAWILTGGRGQGDLSSALRHVAATYRRKAENRAEFLRSALPTFLLLGCGAGAVIVYGLMIFVPLSQVLEQLSNPVNR